MTIDKALSMLQQKEEFLRKKYRETGLRHFWIEAEAVQVGIRCIKLAVDYAVVAIDNSGNPLFDGQYRKGDVNIPDDKVFRYVLPYEDTLENKEEDNGEN